MPRSAHQRLEDILSCCGAIRRFAAGRSLHDYEQDDQLRSATERQFIIIGEAINALCKLEPSTTARLDEARVAVEFRNQLVHGYFYIENTLVWDVVQRHLPILERKVQTWIDELQHDNPAADSREASAP